MKEERWKVSSEFKPEPVIPKSDTTDVDLLCDICGKPVGNIWVATPDYEILCIRCFRRRTAV